MDNTFTSLDILDYILAVLYSHRYREKYKDELKIDYPRVPYPLSGPYFRVLSNFGERIRTLLTGKANIQNIEYDVHIEDSMVERYKLQNNKIYINKSSYFYSPNDNQNLQEIWEYNIGGNSVLQKWLKDRKGITISKEDVYHYLSMMASIKKIILLMEDVDRVIEL